MQLWAPAKINLFLYVTGRRSDGYHELFTLMCPIAVYDRLTLSFDTDTSRIICTDPQVPADESNLALRAASSFGRALAEARTHPDVTGVEITIDKRIPVAAGLGGGSTDAAAVLHGLNRHYGRPFDREDLMRMALPLGADVPFCLYGRPALATGIGERLAPAPRLAAFKVVLVDPGVAVSTAEVYRELKLGLTKAEKKIRKSLLKTPFFDAARYAHNDLESVTLMRFDEVARAKAALEDQGAEAALMAGSGGSVFGLFRDALKARDAQAALAEEATWRVILTDMLI